MLPAARAVAVQRDPERRLDLEPDPAAEAAPADDFGHGVQCTRRDIAYTDRLMWELIFMMLILKIPIVYLILVVYWAIKAEPKPPEPAVLPVAVGPDPQPRTPWVARRRPPRRPSRGGPHTPRPRAGRASVAR
jgi:hypothetical protein